MKKILLTFILLAIPSGLLFADTPDPDAAEMQLYSAQLANPHEAWLTETWTDNNTPYQTIRRVLDALNSKHLITISLMDSYRQSYRKHLDDPEQAFRWVYATYLLQQSGTSLPQEDMAYPQILDRFPRPSPKTYDYTRLRFLLAVKGIAKPKYKAIATRLYTQNPYDVPVTAAYARVLSMTHSQADETKAVHLAQNLIHQEPDSPKHETLLGSIYFNAWYDHHNPVDKTQAIEAYQKFLSKAPINDPFRSQANILIDMLKKSP